jgi:hypothetical protein
MEIIKLNRLSRLDVIEILVQFLVSLFDRKNFSLLQSLRSSVDLHGLRLLLCRFGVLLCRCQRGLAFVIRRTLSTLNGAAFVFGSNVVLGELIHIIIDYLCCLDIW